VITLIRILAIPMGIVLVIASAFDVAGLVPHSDAMPPLAERLRHSLPIAIGSAALLLPYRKVSSPRPRVIVAGILSLFAAWVLYLSVEGASEYVSGRKSWHVLPASGAMLCLIAGNLWAFARITGKAFK
jgi:peptidoglycan/LPS O-acetylase OafA/YrhL